MTNRLFPVTALFLLLAYGLVAQAPTLKAQVEGNLHLQTLSDREVSTMSKDINEQMKAYNIPGASVAVINNGKIDWVESYGVIANGTTEEVDESTLFQCASIGKLITSIAALQLVEQGYIGLDDPVNNKLKRWKIKDNELTEKQPVSLRHLLSHSSGLQDSYGFLGYAPDEEAPSILQVLNNEKPSKGKRSLEIKTVPGTVEKYSGAGYVIIQLLIEDLTDETFEAYVSENILAPIGMNNTYYDDNPEAKLAHGHKAKGVPLKEKKYHIYPEKAAAGPWTTAHDLALLIIEIQRAMKGESTLSIKASDVQEMMSPQINNKGLGVNLKGFGGTQAFWHAGQNLGYTGLLYGTLENDSGAVILLNTDAGERFMQEFISSVANTYQWPVMRSYKILDVNKEDQKNMLGTYYSSVKDSRLYIKEKKGQLYLSKSEKRKGYRLYRVGDNHFTFKNAQDYYKVWFESNFTTLNFLEGLGKTVSLQKEKQKDT
ncbi:MAG: beta-lactamase family protein [Ekhidna sp.]|nr:beta-lactamase family protein [Ekhidna sp.]